MLCVIEAGSLQIGGEEASVLTDLCSKVSGGWRIAYVGEKELNSDGGELEQQKSHLLYHF